MTRSDRAFSRIVLGLIAPISLFLAGWWGSLGIFGDSPVIAPAALGGLALGIALNLTVLRSRLDSLFELRAPALVAIALFYSVGAYGFFMGFPVFNVLVGLAGGYVVGRRAVLHALPAEQARREARNTAAVATGILAALCAASAWLALTEESMCPELQHMLGLPFTVTWPMVYALIGVGGVLLLAAEWWGTLAMARRANRAA